MRIPVVIPVLTGESARKAARCEGSIIDAASAKDNSFCFLLSDSIFEGNSFGFLLSDSIFEDNSFGIFFLFVVSSAFTYDSSIVAGFCFRFRFRCTTFVHLWLHSEPLYSADSILGSISFSEVFTGWNKVEREDQLKIRVCISWDNGYNKATSPFRWIFLSAPRHYTDTKLDEGTTPNYVFATHISFGIGLFRWGHPGGAVVSQTVRLDQNSLNSGAGKLSVKMSAY